MKKISYYVAAFALCCGVSQTLTSCIEETEEPDDVKALRQAEIAKINADAEKVKAEAAAEEASALESKANAAKTDALTAEQLLKNSVKEGAISQEIAKEVATFESAIKTAKNNDVAAAKTAAKAFQAQTLNEDCPSYKQFAAAEIKYLGGINQYGSFQKGTVTLLEEAEAKLKTDVAAIKEKATKLNNLSVEKISLANALQAQKDAQKDYNDAYKKKTEDIAKALSTLKGFSTTETYQGGDEDAADLKAEADIVWGYLIEKAQIDADEAANNYDLVKDDLAQTGSLWRAADGSGVYDKYLKAKDENDAAKADYEKYKAQYEEELAALKAVNQ